MNLVCFGAHPDDCEVFAGGLALTLSRRGHHVTCVSLTNGDAGHQTMGRAELAARRRAEVARAAEIGGYEGLVLDYHDGELLASLDVREAVIRIIRERRADAVIAHRPWDYHPDHRNAALVVQDAAYMVTVPAVCPGVPALARNPVFLYLYDAHTRPAPFHPDVALDIGPVMEDKWRLLMAMESQFFEWLPWHEGVLDTVPPVECPCERLDWLRRMWSPFLSRLTESARPLVARQHDPVAADALLHAEVFEVCEYGRPLSPEEAAVLSGTA